MHEINLDNTGNLPLGRAGFLHIILQRVGGEVADHLRNAEPSLDVLAGDCVTKTAHLAVGAIANIGGVDVGLGYDNVVPRGTRREDLLGGSNYLIAGLKLIVLFGCVEPSNYSFDVLAQCV